VILALLVGCGPGECDHELVPETAAVGTDAPFEGYEPADCTPDEAAWTATVEPVVTERCGSCHGTAPSYGAPNTLVDYDALIQGIPGNRPADRLARRVALKTMPPPTSAALDHDQLDVLVEWATCGQVHPDHSVGLQVDRDPYAAVVPENLDLPSFDVVATGFQVQSDTLDRYQCFAIDAPIDEARLLQRLQVVIDDARVLHHVVLRHDRNAATAGLDAFLCDDGPDGSMTQLYAWAPGTPSFDFEDGGLRIEPGERLVVEIHYNNGAGLHDVVDHSGVRVFHGPTGGTEWELLDLGPADFEVPEGDSAVCHSSEVFVPWHFLAGMPHMHELGAEFHTWVERADGSTESIVNLTGWNFEAQRIYDYDTELRVGDTFHMWCGFRNETGEPAVSGFRTSEEMCFDFVFGTPL
jgi:hypothetical protein